MANKIWCLFSEEERLASPDRVLEAWWQKQPTREQVYKVLDTSPAHFTDDFMAGIKCICVRGYWYRLEQVEEAR